MKKYLVYGSFLVVVAVIVVGALLQPTPVPATPTTAPTQTARVEYEVVTATPLPDLGWVSTESVVVVGHRGDYVERVVKVRSINAQGWGANASCPGLKGVEFHPASGGLSSGSESEVRIQIHDSATVGYCEGDIVVVFWASDGLEEKHSIKFQLTVLP